MIEADLMTSGKQDDWARVTKILTSADFIAPRYETRYEPATGITAVVNQEQRVFHRRGVIVAPWCPRMKEAQNGLTSGRVVEAGVGFQVPWGDGSIGVRVLEAQAPDLAPIIYVGAPGFFEGIESPYDTHRLERDAVFFGCALEGLLNVVRASPRQFIWGADWECVPGLLLLRPRHQVAITLHNTFDAHLAAGALESGRAELKILGGVRTALSVICEHADVVTTVNRGYAHGLGHEPFHLRVMAQHLQPLVGRIVGIDNANFEDLAPSHLELANTLQKDLAEGVRRVERDQDVAARGLPDGLCEKVRGKVLCVSMGRRSSQKLHDVVVESVRELLSTDPGLPIFVHFATTHGDDGSPARLRAIQELCEQFPENTAWSDGRIPYFSQLMTAASFNIMCSLWAPHEGAFQGTIVPVARAIDGLALQVCPFHPTGEAARMALLWHSSGKTPSGFTFREAPGDEDASVRDLRGLLVESPSPRNGTFWRMAASLSDALRNAVQIRKSQPLVYGRLVLGALEEQMKRSWLLNLGGMLALIESARVSRALESTPRGGGGPPPYQTPGGVLPLPGAR